MSTEKEIDKFKPNLLDSSVTVSKMMANLFPGVGSIAEGLSFLIKGQRLDRVCDVLESIIKRVDELSLSVQFLKNYKEMKSLSISSQN